MNSILPPQKEPTEQKSVRLTQSQWKRIEAISEERNNSLSEVVHHFVRWCFQTLDRAARGEPGTEARWLLDKLADRKEAERLEAELSKALKAQRVQP